jgi:hypothetical protein
VAAAAAKAALEVGLVMCVLDTQQVDPISACSSSCKDAAGCLLKGLAAPQGAGTQLLYSCWHVAGLIMNIPRLAAEL